MHMKMVILKPGAVVTFCDLHYILLYNAPIVALAHSNHFLEYLDELLDVLEERKYFYGTVQCVCDQRNNVETEISLHMVIVMYRSSVPHSGVVGKNEVFDPIF